MSQDPRIEILNRAAADYEDENYKSPGDLIREALGPAKGPSIAPASYAEVFALKVIFSAFLGRFAHNIRREDIAVALNDEMRRVSVQTVNSATLLGPAEAVNAVRAEAVAEVEKFFNGLTGACESYQAHAESQGKIKS